MAERVSAAQRIRAQSVAEREIMRYAGDHAMWHKYVHNVELDAVQVLKMYEMDQHRKTIDFSSRRTGKTAGKEMYLLEDNATNADQELGVVAPRQAQAQVNITYHTDAIRRAPLLQAFLAYESGRAQISDLKYKFANRSRAEAYGVMSNADGGDMTSISLEEVDDMPKERLYSRFLLMLGSTRRLGASKDSKNEPQVRITGVFKGADTLTDLLNTKNYYVPGALRGEAAIACIRGMVENGDIAREALEIDTYSYPLPILNAPNAVKLGLLNGAFLEGLRSEMSDDEYVRQLLCVNTASRNLVWELYLRKAITMGLVTPGIQWTPPVPGQEYRKRGLITFGYDHLGHGETPESSKSAFVVLERIGIFDVVLFCKTWAPGTDEFKIKNDIKFFWKYFRPDGALGDAYGIGLLTALNDELFREGLTTIDRQAIGDGQSTASTWPEWAFSPIMFQGMTKHQMACSVRAMFHDEQAVIPYHDDKDDNPEEADLRLLVRQVTNIRAEVTKVGYASYKQVNTKIGDDLFDALMAARWAMVARGVETPAVVLLGKKSREQMLARNVA